MSEQPPWQPPPPPYGAPPGWQPPPPPYGAPSAWQPYGYPKPANTNGFCIAALVCSLVGIILIFVGPVLGIVFGAVGLRQTERLGESGRGLAIAGIVVGAVMLLINIAVVIGVATGHTDSSSGGVTV